MPADVTNQIRERIDLLDLISSHVRLQKSGSSYKGLCPFHEEKTPSFHVNPERRLWHCFGCGEHGDCFSFVMKQEALSFPEALSRLAAKAGVTLEKGHSKRNSGDTEALIQSLSVAARFFEAQLKASERARQYMSSRYIDAETAALFGVGFAPEGWENLATFLAAEKVDLSVAAKAGLVGRRSDGSFYDRFRNRLIFPVSDSADRVVGFGGRDMGTEGPKYLNSPETPVFHKGSILYGYGLARKAIASSRRVVIVEGYLDVISAHRAGITSAVAAMGTAIGDGHTRLLKHLCDQVVICLDSDGAGRKATLAAGIVFEEAGFDTRTATLPIGEDPDSMVASGRRDVLQDAIDNAVSAAEHRLDALLASYDLTDKSNSARMLARASEMLAKIANVFERDRLIGRLAGYHPSFARNPQLAEQRIRGEVEKLARSGGKQVRPKVSSSSAPEKAPRPASGLEQAERVLLRCLLDGGELAAGLVDKIAPDDFVTEQGRALAEEALARVGAGDDAASLVLSEELSDSPVSRLASELMVEGDGPPVTQAVIDDCLRLLDTQGKRYALAQLQDRFKRGELSREDPEFQRLMELQREGRT